MSSKRTLVFILAYFVILLIFFECVSRLAISIFIYLPMAHEIMDPDELTGGEAFLYEYSQTNEKVKCFSSRPHFRKKAEQGPKFKLGGHWCPFGHLTAAEAIRDYLINQGYVVIQKGE